MGEYINPKGMTKEKWLEENAMGIDGLGTWKQVPEGQLPVCLVDNGPFTVAAIAYDKREFQEFRRWDGRPKRWFLVTIHSLFTVTPSLAERTGRLAEAYAEYQKTLARLQKEQKK